MKALKAFVKPLAATFVWKQKLKLFILIQLYEMHGVGKVKPNIVIAITWQKLLLQQLLLLVIIND